jgi:hypothetical protein
VKDLIGQVVSQVASLLTIHAMPIGMIAANSGREGGAKDAASSAGESVDLWLRSWVAPALLLAVGTIVFQAGVFVGRGNVHILEERISNHEQIGLHSEAMRRTEIEAELRVIRSEINQTERVVLSRLDQIELLLMNGPLPFNGSR